MKKRFFSILMCSVMALGLAACGADSADPSPSGSSETADETSAYAGETLSILVSAGWMDNAYDEIIERFEETYDVTVDLQSIPADQYDDVLQSKLTTDSCADVFWIQSDPFSIESVIGNPEEYCIDFSDAEWKDVIPEARLESCEYNGTLYGLQIYSGSPNYVMVYNKTLFDENGWEEPTTYEEFKELCGEILDAGITPWYMPGADGWQHQLVFFQIGGVYEQAQPGLYEDLNTNQATYADNETMITVLEEIKEFSDLGYFGEDWIGTDSTNLINAMGEREAAMIISGSGVIAQIAEETGCEDEFGLFVAPFAENQVYSEDPSGPTMFGYQKSEHPELVKEWFSFVAQTESLQSILDNHPSWTNLDVNDDDLQQDLLEVEEEFLEEAKNQGGTYIVLQTGTRYSNDCYYDFGNDLVAYCQGTITDANEVLQNMDKNRAEAAKANNDANWE